MTSLPMRTVLARDSRTPPIITTQTAFLILSTYALLYFVPFYFSKQARPSPTLSRNAVSVIRARIASVTRCCILCCLATLALLTWAADFSVPDALHLMGLWPFIPVDAWKPLFLTVILFVGPLCESLVIEAGWRNWLRLDPLRELWSEWTTWRNIVAGPITEEVLFRTTSIPLLLLAHTPATQIVFLAPLVFGLAHVHHFWESRLTNPQIPILAAVLVSLLHLTYTTAFGAYAAFIYLRTGSLVVVCAVHAFCNCMGLPRFWGRVDLASREGWDPPEAEVTAWSVAYYVLLGIGAWGWWRYLWMLTDSPNALVSPTTFGRS